MDHENKIVRQFSRSAPLYLNSAIHAKGKDLIWLKKVFKSLMNKNKALDVATGAGHTAFLASRYFHHVIALDLTRNMLTVAQEEAMKRNLANIIFLLGDAASLPFLDNTFDLVTCRIAAHHFPNPEQAVREMHRVLNPKGLLILIDNIAPEDSQTAKVLHHIEKLRDPSHVRCLAISDWQHLFDQTGFSNVTLHQTWSTAIELTGWLDRANTSCSNREQIYPLLKQLPPSWFKDQTIYLQKAFWICKKQGSDD